MADSDKMTNVAIISVRVEKSGRVLIPAAIRRQLGLKEGESDLLLNIDETPILATTRVQALRRIQEWAVRGIDPGRLISEELLEERHREAAGEFSE
jgi:AbrB family looped-hinge helix DNA binding protein